MSLVFRRRILCILLYSFILLGIVGCGYRLVGLGSLPKHIKTIAIPVFENNTLEEGVEEIITRAVIDVYVRGGRVKLVSEADADAVLWGVIRSYNSDEAATYNELNEVSSYLLRVTVDIKLMDLSKDNVLWETEGLTEEADFDGGPDVDLTTEQENEAKALQQVAEELAGQIWVLSTEDF